MWNKVTDLVFEKHERSQDVSNTSRNTVVYLHWWKIISNTTFGVRDHKIAACTQFIFWFAVKQPGTRLSAPNLYILHLSKDVLPFFQFPKSHLHIIFFCITQNITSCLYSAFDTLRHQVPDVLFNFKKPRLFQEGGSVYKHGICTNKQELTFYLHIIKFFHWLLLRIFTHL